MSVFHRRAPIGRDSHSAVHSHSTANLHNAGASSLSRWSFISVEGVSGSKLKPIFTHGTVSKSKYTEENTHGPRQHHDAVNLQYYPTTVKQEPKSASQTSASTTGFLSTDLLLFHPSICNPTFCSSIYIISEFRDKCLSYRQL